ncbi:aspartic peptidase domain-containing protein [Nemania sp. FL0916]|nr:aspartic peptidase domain-containing protein [Nemania sp. FL0916]
MLLSDIAVWRVAVALTAVFPALTVEAAVLQGRAGDSSALPANTTTNVFRESGQVLTVPLKRVNHNGIATPSLAKRFFKTDVLGVFGAAYLAELTIGTSKNGGKKQVVEVLIDTGSFELWVNPVCEKSNVPDFCQVFGHYDPALSSTSQKITDVGFNIKYGSGEVAGDYYKDDIYISGSKIKQQQFGVAKSSDLVWFGIMGLGHGLGNGFTKYPLVVDSLAAQGLVNTKLFSMDLGQQGTGAAITGEMVFGGVDKNKYSGFLKKVPTDPADPHYKVTLNGIAHREPGADASTPITGSDLPLPAIIDSGTTLSLLPEAIVNKIAARFPGAKSDGKGGYRVDCAFKGKDGSVDFEIAAAAGTVTINIAYNDFIWNSGNECFLGAWFSDDLGIWILGDTFLRGAYVAFDQTNNAVFMSNHASCGDGRSNLAAVPAGPDAAGKIRGACPEVPTHSMNSSSPLTTSPGGSAPDTVIPSVSPSLGASLKPVEPSNTRTLTSYLSTATQSSISASTALVSSSQPASTEAPKILPQKSASAESDDPTTTVTTTICTASDSAPAPLTTGTDSSDSSDVIFTEMIAPPATKIGGSGSSRRPGDAGMDGGEGGGFMTTTYASTTVSTVTACNPADAACTLGMTTTRAFTVVKTLKVQPEPTATTTRSPYGYGQNTTTWNNTNTNSDHGTPVVAAAPAAGDDGVLDRRYLGAMFVFVWGIMVLL